MMKKTALAAIAVLAISLAGTSFAGERTGNGGFTPIENILIPGPHTVLNALCAFSGLEDNDGGEVTPGDTQTPHEEGGEIQLPGAARICAYFNHGRKPPPKDDEE